MYTISESPKRIVNRSLSEFIVIGFPLASGYTVPHQYDQVKLNTDGTVSPIAATTDKPFGYIESAYTKTDSGTVRIALGIKAQMRGECDGTLTPGDEVTCSGIDSSLAYETSGAINKFKTAASGDYVIGICLVGGLTTTVEAQIGLHMRPYLKP